MTVPGDRIVALDQVAASQLVPDDLAHPRRVPIAERAGELDDPRLGEALGEAIEAHPQMLPRACATGGSNSLPGADE
jgi:hypothetical protein